jgi:hypothetical protein
MGERWWEPDLYRRIITNYVLIVLLIYVYTDTVYLVHCSYTVKATRYWRPTLENDYRRMGQI